MIYLLFEYAHITVRHFFYLGVKNIACASEHERLVFLLHGIPCFECSVGRGIPKSHLFAKVRPLRHARGRQNCAEVRDVFRLKNAGASAWVSRRVVTHV